MTTLADRCREDVRRLFEGDMSVEELKAAWGWLDDRDKADIPHWQDEREERER